MNDTHEDWLLTYVQAFDRGDFQVMAYVFGMAGEDTGLQTAINVVHRCFNLDWSFTAQLLDYRATLVKSEVQG